MENLDRRRFVRNSSGLTLGILGLSDMLFGLPDLQSKIEEDFINNGEEYKMPKTKSFVNKSRPVISGIIAGRNPQEIISFARNSETQGADGITVDLFDLELRYRTKEVFESIINSVNLPFMFYFYRNDKWSDGDDEYRQEVLLSAVDAGASMVDVMGDLYDPSPREITYKQKAIDQQKRLIDKIHNKNAEVVISSHTGCFLSTDETVEHMKELEFRGADVVKIVTTIDTQEEFAQAIKTTIVLNDELQVPFIHLCGGKYRRPHRFICPILGTSISFAVPEYNDRYPGLSQPTIRSMRAVIDNIRWFAGNMK